jgi:hypothetical protein
VVGSRWSVVDNRWSVVGNPWPIVGQWFVVGAIPASDD